MVACIGGRLSNQAKADLAGSNNPIIETSIKPLNQAQLSEMFSQVCSNPNEEQLRNWKSILNASENTPIPLFLAVFLANRISNKSGFSLSTPGGELTPGEETNLEEFLQQVAALSRFGSVVSNPTLTD